MSGAKYPIATLRDIAAIPADALPRFLAELPRILAAREEVLQGIPALAAIAKSAAPWPARWFSQSFFEAMLIRQLETKSLWVDDDKGTVTVSMAMRRGDDPFFRQTEQMPPVGGQ